MNTENGENMEIYTGWLAIWVLLGCYKREFFRVNEEITAEKIETLRERSAEMIAHIKKCKEAGFLRLEDIDKGGGYAAILRGLSAIEEQAEQAAAVMTAEKWRELEHIAIRIRIHAWSQRMRAYGRILQEKGAEVTP